MPEAHWTDPLYQAIDAKDTKRFLSFLTDTAQFRFGNLPPAVGHAATGAMVDGFFAAIGGSRHEILHNWEVPGHLVSQGVVHYTRLDGRQVTVNFVNVFAMRGTLIQDYLIYIDNTPLFAP